MNTTSIYPLYWQFARNRQDIFIRRFQGQPSPWTHDPILQQYRFTNVFRASDRVSQHLIRNVIYAEKHPADYSQGDVYALPDTVYRVLLFKLFNLPDTWEYLETKVGQICWYDGCTDEYVRILAELRKDNRRLYNNAYMMQGRKMHKAGFVSDYKFDNHIRALGHMMSTGLPEKLYNCKSMADMYQVMYGQPYLGKFLTYQFIIDLCYSPWFNFDENEFVMAGPGAERGLRKIFSDIPASSKAANIAYIEALHWLVDHQTEEQLSLGIEPVTLFGRKLHLIDVQNLCCEVDKYTRVALPDADHFGYTRIKQQYRYPDPRSIVYFFPPKWGINDNLKPHIQEQ